MWLAATNGMWSAVTMCYLSWGLIKHGIIPLYSSNLLKENFLYSQHFWHQICGCSTSGNSLLLCRYQLGVLWFNSYTNGHSPQIKGSVLKGCPPFYIPITSSGFPGSPLFRLTWLKSEVPTPLLQFGWFAIMASRTWGITLFTFTVYYQGYYKWCK